MSKQRLDVPAATLLHGKPLRRLVLAEALDQILQAGADMSNTSNTEGLSQLQGMTHPLKQTRHQLEPHSAQT